MLVALNLGQKSAFKHQNKKLHRPNVFKGKNELAFSISAFH